MKPSEKRKDVTAPVDRGKGKGLTDLNVTGAHPPATPSSADAAAQQRGNAQEREQGKVRQPAAGDDERNGADRDSR